MTIAILPARLANQIAAGEVVERPASVVKELIENSLDAGATAIKIDIEKGGAKRIRISDNGCGIVKEELTLALSRHATSKIKNLADLEAIGSLGFRGEALASISSVARLTLTSKPKSQENAWQACAQGRDMQVTILPAAHTDGTTIDVVDLFFNTPARRKFLRTEKTEFSHIEEVIKRIALARFDVAITLTHNGKIVRQYRVATTDGQKARRVAQVCGQAFIDHALSIDCQHDGLHLSGWLAKPSFSRNQNDLCYSYVNGRMMRDKLINHAIRQSYQEMLDNDHYPAFVLYLELDTKEVDVNVHPAKHEVRFHQGRYVHDFIYSVCYQALIAPTSDVSSGDNLVMNESQSQQQAVVQAYQDSREYVSPLSSQSAKVTQQRSASSTHRASAISTAASENYQRLMTPINEVTHTEQVAETAGLYQVGQSQLRFIAPAYAIYFEQHQPRLLSLTKLKNFLLQQQIARQWHKGLTSQPLLLPVKLKLSEQDVLFIDSFQPMFEQLGVVVQTLNKQSLQVRQYPALLREQDVSTSFASLVTKLQAIAQQKSELTEQDWQNAMATVATAMQEDSPGLDENTMQALYRQLLEEKNEVINHQLHLNSVAIDLTSAIQALN